jgi:nitrate/nitrite transporter NarK
VNAWQVAGNWGFLFMALGLLILGSGFLIFTRWSETPTGKALAAFFISTNAIIILSVLRLFQLLTPDNLWYWILRAAVFVGGGGAVFAVSIMFVRLQFIRRRSGDKERQEVHLD